MRHLAWRATARGVVAIIFTFACLRAPQLSAADATPYVTYLPSIQSSLRLPPTFADDFTNPQSGWPTTSDGIATYDYLPGEYQILITQPFYLVLAGHGYLATDFSAQVDVRSAGQNNGGAGLFFGETSAGFYDFEWLAGGGFSLTRYDVATNTLTYLVRPVFGYALGSGDVLNHLRVTRAGSTITISANDQQIAQVTDSTYGLGYIGLSASADSSYYSTNGFDARFDNFVVTEATPGTLGAPGTVLKSIPIGVLASDVAFNPATGLLYVVGQGSGNGTTFVAVDPVAGKVVATIPYSTTSLTAVAVNTRTNRVYVADQDFNRLDVIDGVTNQQIALIPVGWAPDGVAVDEATNRVYVANGADRTVSVVDGASDTPLATIGGFKQPTALAVDPIRNRIYVANNNANDVAVIDGGSNSVVATFPVGGDPRYVTLNASAGRAYSSCVTSAPASIAALCAFNTVSNTWIATVAADPDWRYIWYPTVNPSTGLIYLSEQMGISVIDGATNNIVGQTFIPGWGQFQGIAVDPIRNWVYAPQWVGTGSLLVVQGYPSLSPTTNATSLASAAADVRRSTSRVPAASTATYRVPSWDEPRS